MTPEERRVEQLETTQSRQDQEITQLKIISERLLTIVESHKEYHAEMREKVDGLAKAYGELQATITSFVDIKKQMGEMEKRIAVVEKKIYGASCVILTLNALVTWYFSR